MSNNDSILAVHERNLPTYDAMLERLAERGGLPSIDATDSDDALHMTAAGSSLFPITVVGDGWIFVFNFISGHGSLDDVAEWGLNYGMRNDSASNPKANSLSAVISAVIEDLDNGLIDIAAARSELAAALVEWI